MYCPKCGSDKVILKSSYICESCSIGFEYKLTQVVCPCCGKMTCLEDVAWCHQECEHCGEFFCPRCYSKVEEDREGEIQGQTVMDKCTKCDWRCCGQCN
jgi:hypothetical protein